MRVQVKEHLIDRIIGRGGKGWLQVGWVGFWGDRGWEGGGVRVENGRKREGEEFREVGKFM